jgi:hypothetical protein
MLILEAPLSPDSKSSFIVISAMDNADKMVLDDSF